MLLTYLSCWKQIPSFLDPLQDLCFFFFLSLGLCCLSLPPFLPSFHFFPGCCPTVSLSPNHFPWTQHPHPESQLPPWFRWSWSSFRFWAPHQCFRLPLEISSWIFLHFILSMSKMQTIKFLLMKYTSFCNILFHLLTLSILSSQYFYLTFTVILLFYHNPGLLPIICESSL